MVRAQASGYVTASRAPTVVDAFVYDGWELRTTTRELVIGGEAVRVGSRAFDLLLALAERNGGLVTYRELLDSVWAGLVVEENNISVQVATLRKVIGRDAIATVPGKGYRLTARRRSPQESTGTRHASMDGGAAAGIHGRSGDVDAVLVRITASPLVTVLGMGGVGKTSLARAVCAGFAETAAWIDLSSLRDRAQVVTTFAAMLGVAVDRSRDGIDDLIAALAERALLVVVDNCEHLVSEVSQIVSRALLHAPRVRWLATSQVALALPEESIYRLEPLGVPPVGAAFDESMRHGAFSLLVERASKVDRHFALDDETIPLAISICRALDGLPLAIEMAAARIAALGIVVVHRQITANRVALCDHLPRPTRQATLRATFDWSHALLTPDEQRVFRRLAIFDGAFEYALAERVVTDDVSDAERQRLVPVFSALVEKSLVIRCAGAPSQFQMFESIRLFALQRLDDAHEAQSVRERFAAALIDLFADSEANLDAWPDRRWSDTYVPYRAQLRSTVRLALEAADADTVARLVAALARIELFVREPAEIVNLAITEAQLDAAAPEARAAAKLELSWAHYLDGNRRVGAALAEGALRDFVSMDDRVRAYRALAQLVCLQQSCPGMDDDAARNASRLAETSNDALPLRTRIFCLAIRNLTSPSNGVDHRSHETLTLLAEHAGFDGLAAACRIYLIDEALIDGRYEDVVDAVARHFREGAVPPRTRGVALVNCVLALVALDRMDEAAASARAALRIVPGAAHHIVAPFALAHARAGRLSQAALLVGFCEARLAARQELQDCAEARAMAETVAALVTGMASEVDTRFRRTGATLSATQALAIAIATRQS